VIAIGPDGARIADLVGGAGALGDRADDSE
jgi:hypothetical protein